MGLGLNIIYLLLLISLNCCATRFQVFENKFYELDLTLNALCVYDLQTKQRLSEYPTGIDGVEDILVDGDRRQLLVIHPELRCIAFFDLKNFDNPTVVITLKYPPKQLVIGGSTLFVSNPLNSCIEVFDLQKGGLVNDLHIEAKPTYLYVHGFDLFILTQGKVWQIDIRTLVEIKSIVVDPLAGFALANNEHLFTLSSRTSVLKVTDYQDRKECWEFALMRVARHMLLIEDTLIILHGHKPKLCFIDCTTLTPLHSIALNRQVVDIISYENDIYVCSGEGQFLRIPILPNKKDILGLIKNEAFMKYLPKKLNLQLNENLNELDFSTLTFGGDSYTLECAAQLIYRELMDWIGDRRDQMNLSRVSKKFRLIFDQSRAITDLIFVDFIRYSWGGNFEQARKIFWALKCMGYKPARLLKDKAENDGLFGLSRRAKNPSS